LAGAKELYLSPFQGSFLPQPYRGLAKSARPRLIVLRPFGALGLQQNVNLFLRRSLARISHKISTAAAQTGMSIALRSVGLLDVLSSTSAGPSVALAEKRQMRLVSTPVCAASLRNLVRNAG